MRIRFHFYIELERIALLEPLKGPKTSPFAVSSPTKSIAKLQIYEQLP